MYTEYLDDVDKKDETPVPIEKPVVTPILPLEKPGMSKDQLYMWIGLGIGGFLLLILLIWGMASIN